MVIQKCCGNCESKCPENFKTVDLGEILQETFRAFWKWFEKICILLIFYLFISEFYTLLQTLSIRKFWGNSKSKRPENFKADNFEKIWVIIWGNKSSEILRKFLRNVRKILKYAIFRKFWKKFFLYSGNNLKNYIFGNFKAVLSKRQENCKTNNFEKIIGYIFCKFWE